MRRNVAALAAFVLVALAGATSEAQSPAVVGSAGGDVSVHAQAVPLGELLRALATLTPMVLKVDPAVEGRLVSIVLDRVSVERAIRSVIRESGVDSVMVGLERLDSNVPIRVVAGDARKAVAVSAVPEKAADPVAVATPAPPDEAELQAAKEQERAQQEVEAAMPPGPPSPGSMTNEQWMRALFPAGAARPARSGAVMLPFVGDDGQPLMENVAPNTTQAMLPFVDEFDRPIVVPVQPRTDGMIMLPFTVTPDVPLLVPAPFVYGAAPTLTPGMAPRLPR